MEPSPNTFIHLEFLRKTLLPLPGVTEKPSYGTPGFFVGKKLFARIKEDGETLVVQSFERDKWIRHNQEAYFVTDHYLNYDYVLVNLRNADPTELTGMLLTAWRNRATGKLIKQYDKEHSNP